MGVSAIPPSVRRTVLVRDGFRCLAPQIDRDAGWCRSAFGTVITHWYGTDPGPIYLQMSHVKDRDRLSMGKKAEADEYHLVSLCPGHHTGTVAGSCWETRNREHVRRYLEDLYRPGRNR